MTAVLLSLALACAPTVTPWEYRHIHTGDTRAHVQRVFDTHGHRVYLYYGPTGWAHLAKAYPASDGGTVTVRYSHGPRQQVWRVAHRDPKEWTA